MLTSPPPPPTPPPRSQPPLRPRIPVLREPKPPKFLPPAPTCPPPLPGSELLPPAPCPVLLWPPRPLAFRTSPAPRQPTFCISWPQAVMSPPRADDTRVPCSPSRRGRPTGRPPPYLPDLTADLPGGATCPLQVSPLRVPARVSELRPEAPRPALTSAPVLVMGPGRGGHGDLPSVLSIEGTSCGHRLRVPIFVVHHVSRGHRREGPTNDFSRSRSKCPPARTLGPPPLPPSGVTGRCTLGAHTWPPPPPPRSDHRASPG